MMNGNSAQRVIAAALAVSVTLASGEALAFRGMARTSIHPMGGNFGGGAQMPTRPGFNGGGEYHGGGQPGPQPHPPAPQPNPNPNPHPPGPGPGPQPHPPGPPPGPGPHPPAPPLPPPPPPGYWGGGWYVDPVAAAVTVGITAAVVGSMVATLPPACTTVVVGGATYEQCGETWYQPQYVGAQVQYVVVNAPR
ncbi:DUF6515 family protein [Paraburkholderia bannensis]|uniref:DUF6515 family protein n=1 Tax=Paraburkholderia bannensis TaxID=765414 RepID=UPI002AC34BB3|nr:DUF6515 family protein [Paraburkholderia bannensis]